MAHTTSSAQVLSISDAVDLGVIVDSAVRTARVARLLDGGLLVRGTARSIGDDCGNFAGRDDDVRDCFLRVTTDSGLEVFWSVAELIPEVSTGMFSLYEK